MTAEQTPNADLGDLDELIDEALRGIKDGDLVIYPGGHYVHRDPAEQNRALTDPPAGVGTAMELADAIEGSRLCGIGYHAWVPWLTLPSGSFATWCSRPGCNHGEQYDL